MSELPVTLEEMQRDILQYDLSNNPYLQGSVIPARDKELKTKAKKIIPAINEILKNVETFTSGVQKFMEDVEKRFNALEDSIAEINSKIESFDSTYDISDVLEKYESCNKTVEELKIDMSVMQSVCKCYNESKEVTMKFNSKLKLAEGKGQTINIKATSVVNWQDQIAVYAYEQNSKSYKYINTSFTMQTSSTSIYNFNVRPIELRVNYETDEITIFNNSNYELIIYIFEI